MPETKNISEMLTQLMETENISVDKLATATNIPSRFIIALKEGEFKKLPADPYVRGYLIKIAPILKVESEHLIQSYKESARAWKAGTADELPGNIYAKVPVKKGIIFGVIMLAALLVFLGIRLNDILGIPRLDLEVPAIVSNDTITITGSVKPGDRITLNGETLFTDETGRFERQLFLTPGTNTFEFEVARFLGRSTKVIKQIIYEPPVLPIPSAVPAPGGVRTSPPASIPVR